MSAPGKHPALRVMYIVWAWLLLLTIVEVGLAYLKVPLLVMLAVLVGLSVIKSVLIVAWFMHLRFERSSLVLTLIPALITCILLLNIIFPDGWRLKQNGVFRDLPPPVPGAHAPVEPGH